MLVQLFTVQQQWVSESLLIIFIIFSAQVSMIDYGRAVLLSITLQAFKIPNGMRFTFRVLGLQEQNHLKVVAVIMTIVLVVVLLITLILLKRVIIAVAVIKVQIL
jgi:hypothetical protein